MINLTLQAGKSKRNIQFPEQWVELSPEQLSLIAKNLFSPLSPEELSVRLVVILSGMTIQELRQCTPDTMYEELIPLTDWVRESCDLTEQKIPVIRNFFGRNYYGPSSDLDNLKMSEFDSAEQELFQWNQLLKEADELEALAEEAESEKEKMEILSGKDEILLRSVEHLYRFVATIYRHGKVLFTPGDTTSDRRHPFKPDQVGRNARKLKKILPPGTVYAILLWYKGCRKSMGDLYGDLFDEPEGEEEPQFPNYFSLMRMIAKEQIYGNLEKVEQLTVYNVLTELGEIMEERRKNELLNQNKPEEV